MSNKFIFDKTITGDLKGESSWKSPSNIALVKYWGKKDLQIPKNPSLSFTLSNCFTICKIKFSSSNVSNKSGRSAYAFFFIFERLAFLFHTSLQLQV